MRTCCCCNDNGWRKTKGDWFEDPIDSTSSKYSRPLNSAIRRQMPKKISLIGYKKPQAYVKALPLPT